MHVLVATLSTISGANTANKLTTLDNDIIHVEMIDGTTCWAPSKAKLVGDNRYLILENDYFDENDTSVLPQFIPGDTVIVVEHVFSENKKGLSPKLFFSLHPAHEKDSLNSSSMQPNKNFSLIPKQSELTRKKSISLRSGYRRASSFTHQS
jgi:hypothetical protein